jgi:dCTP deaminase
MSILSDSEIEDELKNGRIGIEPLDLAKQLQPSSIDLRLGNKFRVFRHTERAYIDPKANDNLQEYTEIMEVNDDKPFILHPGEFVLGSTKEYVKMPDNVVGRLEGRSSMGRLGVVVHSTAGYVDPGFRGKLTLEITNLGKMPIALYPDMRICQISFYRMEKASKVPYDKKKDAKYLGDEGPEMSRITKDFNRE